MAQLPGGTVTFLLTDIENSSGQWEEAPGEMRSALAIHDATVAECVASHGGAVVKHMGDGCWAAFGSAPDAAKAAIDCQRRLQRDTALHGGRLLVRIGLHTGEIEPTEGDYFGPVPNRSARVADLANGNQIVCSASTAGLLTGLDLRSDGLHELRGIGVEEIFVIRADGMETDSRPLRRPVVPSNVPAVHTSFHGRDEDQRATIAFLEQPRAVVTLIGPGGVGKTRLAIEVGTELSGRSHRTVQYCGLAGLSEPDAVVAAVAEVVGARQQPGMDLLSSVADYLAERDLLLILDNCEHVADIVRQLVRHLDGASGVSVLATSREALGMPGEQLVMVSPLAVDGPAVALFVDRARQRDASFAMTSDDEAAIREIVARLDGIPLAIELAAARIRLMTPVELAAGLDDRFRLLGGERRGERHETLWATVSWSYDLLSESEARLFDRLSVFAGGCTLSAIELVCSDDELVPASDIPELVMALVDKSMVVSSVHEGRRRFSMLETLRRFGEENLAASGEADGYRRRHADHFCEVAGTQSRRMFSAAEPDAWQVLDSEWANLRAALDTYEAVGEIDSGAELVVALVWFSTMSLRFELFTWASELLELPHANQRPRFADLCGAAAIGAYFTVDGRVNELAEAGLAADPSDPEGFCRTTLAAVLLNNLHSPEASDALTAAWLEADPATPGSRLWAEGFRTFHLCTHDPSRQAAIHAAATGRLADETGSTTAKALAAWSQGQVVAINDRDQAIEVWTAGLEWPRSMPNDHLVEHLLVGLILHFTVRRGDLLHTLEGCRDALDGALERHYYAGTSHLFGVAAIALCRAGDAETGARLVGAMIGHGHLPRPNASRAIDEALGDDADEHLTSGLGLSITKAGHLAIDAIDAAIARLGAVA